MNTERFRQEILDNVISNIDHDQFPSVNSASGHLHAVYCDFHQHVLANQWETKRVRTTNRIYVIHCTYLDRECKLVRMCLFYFAIQIRDRSGTFEGIRLLG